MVQNPSAPVFPNVPTATINPNATTPIGAIQFFQKNFQAPLISQYDAVIERQITKNTVISISYLGSLGRSLPTFFDRNFNPTPSSIRTVTINGGPYAGQTFTTPVYSRSFGSQAITEISSSVQSQYNALVIQANRRFTNGLQFQTSYTFAKATDTGQASTAFTANNTPVNVFDSSFDQGTSRYDVRHKFVFSGVYAPTFYKGSKSLYTYLVNGYSIAPVYALYSGQPYNATVGGITNGFNGTNGDNRLPIIPRNAFRLPRLSNLDVRLSKRFIFGERYNLEFLAEVFNAFNRTHVFGVNTQLYSGTGVSATAATLNLNVQNGINQFGLVTTTDSTLYRERQIQFSSRFQF